MKRADIAPRFAFEDLRQAVQTVRQFAAQPAENEEGYDPHVEHRDYERLKAELRAAKAELERVKALERELEDTLANAGKSAASVTTNSEMDWKRAIVLSEILGKPRSRR